MIFKGLFGRDPREETRNRYAPMVEKIGGYEEGLRSLSLEGLREKTAEFRTRLHEGTLLDDLLPEAFAVVREASRRMLGQRHYDVQLIGGAVLHEGRIAEMRTGEGKTLAATLPVYLNALSGKGVHVVTVNEYLARRDAVWMGQIYDCLGLTVGCITPAGSYLYDAAHTEGQKRQETRPNDLSRSVGRAGDKRQGEGDVLDETRDTVGGFKVVHEFLRSCGKPEAYAADITYGTNNEFGFDYLRDNIAYDKHQLAGRGYHFALVDEIDSILIDEARTPLIISAPSEDAEGLYRTFAGIASTLTTEKDYTVDEKLRVISLTDDGITKTEKALGVENIYTEKGIKFVHHLENAVRARALFHLDKEYVIKNGEIIIVDEFTGRLQPGRRWSEGLHQAIEAKEGLAIQKESRTVASITFQNFFRLYGKLCGMTGTAKTSEEEFLENYGLAVTEIPTHKPTVRADKNDLIFQTEKGKLLSVVRTIKELHETGQPVLVGTVSIEKNEELSGLLTKEGIPHQVLNAKNHEREGEIIAQAGRPSAVTIATNMAGRGVDIILGGNPPEKDAQENVRARGGLFVLGTERHEARRIDNQLRGRAGRQGDLGASQFFVSLEDSLMRVFASDTIKNMMGRFGIPEDQPIENRIITRALESAQTKIEGFHFDARKHVLAFDNVLNHQRQTIYGIRRRLLLGEEDAIREFLEGIENNPDAEARLKTVKERLKERYLLLAGRVILQAIDIHWMEHLETMDHLRHSVNLRAYGQREPLVEYKKDGLRLFKEMQESINQNVADMLVTLSEKEGEAAEIRPEEQMKITTNNPEENSAPASVSQGKVSRNDPCPCGAKKEDGTPIKYKRCHGV
ncbi:MAG: preprotein translocase subunit SecA [Candidatus Lloydbacteria bacterium RIFCSPLOWO2_12_FULL_51_9]|uniref:Protein translocase subunit SecA n=1 Tax=Candidatus Lloydbacteria bacterium RIFCSPLOWO2_12_FULL_51_9 TaxID=1798669 RepID=A0A1G2DSK0_9BACT|nr:MAG: preprotein translocase subunit SecA [Candidatus Lloydbacteria bacterium RIFCSPLOWO2_12_FULL_51_9]